jgi:hypothetical protein
MAFIRPMLCSRLQDAACLTDPRYIVEPKLDGQRAQPAMIALTGFTLAAHDQPRTVAFNSERLKPRPPARS